MQSLDYRFKLASTPSEYRAYVALRRQIFCEEQGIFVDNDRDDKDAIAYPIVALAANWRMEGWDPLNYVVRTDQVVGVVRIYEMDPGFWYGGRLGVHPDFRRQGQIGKGLIHKAVTTANGWGCERFLATVQLQNVRFFRRLHWTSLETLSLCGQPHHLMEADLNFYPPGPDPRPIALADVG